MKSNRWVRLAVLAVLITALPALAFLFGSKDKAEEKTPTPGGATTRYHLKVPDKATEKELLQLFQWKNMVANQIQVIRQLGEEKTKEMAQFEKQLLDRFGIKPTINYAYEMATKTLYELVPKEVGANVDKKNDTREPESKYEKRKHAQLQNDAQVRLYVELATGKKVVADEIRALQLVLQEKQGELERVSKQLSDKFSISRDRSYHYDPKTMRLYEIISAPQKQPATLQATPPQGPIQFR